MEPRRLRDEYTRVAGFSVKLILLREKAHIAQLPVHGRMQRHPLTGMLRRRIAIREIWAHHRNAQRATSTADASHARVTRR
jgi:hypothetical protein